MTMLGTPAATIDDPTVDTSAHVVDEMLAAVVPVLRNCTADGEAQRRLPDYAAAALVEAGAFQVQVPKSLGGLELNPLQATRLVEEISKVDPSAGFLVGNMNSQAFAMMALSADGVEEVFADSKAVICGGAFPPARAVEVPGGYLVSGRAPFASGAHIATWVTAYAMLFEGDQPKMTPHGPVMLLAAMAREDCELVDNWNVLGLRGTGSHDYAYHEVFVPHTRVAPLTLGEPNRYFSGPLYRSRLWSGHPAFAATALGVARASLDEATSLVRTKKGNFMMEVLGDSPSIQRQLGKAEARYRASRAYLYDTVDQLWQHQLTGEFVNTEHGISMQLAACYVIETAREISEIVHEIAGSTGFQESSPLEKYFRDAHTISQHAFASQTRYESAAKAMLGKQNDWLFFQL
ncbi:alkylation response protein AidB-like acyl-CoA dehydrogenase [Micromonospora luteifusca]|uniref:Alkylation response protein AidB-like acyl-CoA dehydrogenase n=1 Tax=Micromonospora luteifusca TaxID=709860 RepID=A0ABS2M1Y9_9ACTN|nr:acyl-CoA dehydrogenase family protein [Micromonospora luteifusca]MBM7494154.1 alkylation response protein AidB-like acyl-CoA dehydrogenase [Micromonospora luteifusca]